MNPLPHLIDLTYAAMDGAARWRDFLSAFAVALSASQSTLSIRFISHPENSFTACGGPAARENVHREPPENDFWLSSDALHSAGEGCIRVSQPLWPHDPPRLVAGSSLPATPSKSPSTP